MSKFEKNLEGDYNPKLLLHKDCIEEGLLRMSPFESHRRKGSFIGFVKNEAGHFPDHVIDDPALSESIVFSKRSHFSKYKDSRILIIGGGPSTNTLDFNSLDVYYLCAGNHFYLNPVLKNTKIDMAMIMGEPDIKSKEFLDYRDKFEPMIGFEIHDRWKGYSFDDYEKYFLMHTDFYSKLGACVRMIIFACVLGVKEVHFVGLDGTSYIKKGEHAFEKGKTTMPSSYNEDSYRYQYKLFWTYVSSCFPNTSFFNHGYGQEYHGV